MPAPHAVKMAVLERYSSTNSPWIETGTYFGQTTAVLAKGSPLVVSLEPDRELYLAASERLKSLKNVSLLNLPSEEGLESAIQQASIYPRVNFWLDGHYSQGPTWRGEQDTPILKELALVSLAAQSGKFKNVNVFVDDCRLFAAGKREDPDDLSRAGYPPLQTLTLWASENSFSWHIEHDIFIANYIES
jgi:hypothetical protein